MTEVVSRERIEQLVRQSLATGDEASAATFTIQSYGQEIFGFIVGLERDESTQDEVFSAFCEDLWNGLAGFRWQSSLRTWCYALARNAFLRQRRAQKLALRRHESFRDSKVSQLIATIRESTAPYQRTDVKERFRHLRESLDPADQMLLILRIDRRMKWRDVATVLAGEGLTAEALKEATSAKQVALLRKRFERVKAQLRTMAIEAGLVVLETNGTDG